MLLLLIRIILSKGLSTLRQERLKLIKVTYRNLRCLCILLRVGNKLTLLLIRVHKDQYLELEVGLRVFQRDLQQDKVQIELILGMIKTLQL
jgi:hypothetical protein